MPPGRVEHRELGLLSIRVNLSLSQPPFRRVEASPGACRRGARLRSPSPRPSWSGRTFLQLVGAIQRADIVHRVIVGDELLTEFGRRRRTTVISCPAAPWVLKREDKAGLRLHLAMAVYAATKHVVKNQSASAADSMTSSWWITGTCIPRLRRCSRAVLA